MCPLFKFHYGWHVLQGDKKKKDIVTCLRILFEFKSVESSNQQVFDSKKKKHALFSETMSMHVMLESKRLSFVSFLLPANLDEMAVI